jgi:IS30 family transposase
MTGKDMVLMSKREASAQIESSLNNRPRKCLGFKTPLEAAFQFVALQS